MQIRWSRAQFRGCGGLWLLASKERLDAVSVYIRKVIRKTDRTHREVNALDGPNRPVWKANWTDYQLLSGS